MYSALKQLLDSQQVPPALLLVGGAEELLANGKSFAQALINTNREIHPDLHLYFPEGKSGIHTIATIQQLIAEVHLPPFEAKAKVFLLDQAHRMLPAAMNALLKTLEEPPSHTYFLLLTNESEALLPTITSRCRKIVLPSASSKELPLDPLLLIQLLKASSQRDTLALLELLSKVDQKDSEDEEAALIFKKCDLLFERILCWYRDLHLLAQKGDPAHLFYKEEKEFLGKTSSFPSLEKVLDLLGTSRTALRQHVKLRVVLQHLFLQMI